MDHEYPSDLLYTREHEWARIDDKIVTIGITHFASEQLGDVTMVELPKEGDDVGKDEAFGSVESVKAVADLYAPVSGKVVAVNGPLNDSPEYVNEDPYDEGWMVKIELKDESEVEMLLSHAAYLELLAEVGD